MPLQLEIVSEHRELVGDDAVHIFREEGGTIGRSLQNDWILPDPDRYISGRHATIDFRGGIYYLMDTSSNGVYLNGDCEPLGRDKPQRLFNGDRIRLGDFEIVVSIDSGESLEMPVADPSNSINEHAASLVEEDHLKTGMLLLDEEEITGDDEFQSALFGSPTDTGVADHAAEIVEEAMEAGPVEPKPLKEADLVATDLLDSFLDGLGISRSELHPSTDLGGLMQNAGEVMREFVEGVTQLLASRANMKNAFRLDQTTVLPRHNNPIKLSANVKDSIMQLLVGKEGEYLGPRDAVREVCRDLLFHQDALLDAMDRSFKEFADRFDPDELKEGFDRSLGSSFLTKFANKKKYWDMYGDLYPILTEKGGGRFPQMYAEEFVTAYERQIAEYKRLGTDVSFKSTVILNQDELAHNAEASQDHIGDTPTELPALQLDDDAIEDLEDNLAVEDVANEDLSAGDFDETPEEPVDRAKA
ncbi:MAG TPA: type VI secretion system-associated FHA domain protein TagH [Woeseiaceae bacterium]|jgi:predicted component of type VI protein secretion system|nr:type VI secretion system-associated FHA domain protein TagH [Woeseiaceae bacterium]